ncbi:DUF177 domain-containing protein [Phaeobacter inhibens]|uniref:YceD family protein n=1 Tax=Phaeobacter inhibens TaxID=221822 RepID=UPI0026E3AEEA|nr:DUF177 domain-containing protein [Phaeobacter inhibens]MDO6755458.1 DUF177 domain-containing protein [Phaeobacter inhibens]
MSESTAFRVADLPQNRATTFELRPEVDVLKALAQDLGIDDLRKLRFAGEIRALGKRDWELVGDLGATVVQPCVVTLDPVTTRIDQQVRRSFIAGMVHPDSEEEVEMPEDDTSEPLGSHISPQEVMVEALALALPQYPRKDGVSLGESVHAEPGVAPMRDEDTKPFAGLAALRDQLDGGGED